MGIEVSLEGRDDITEKYVRFVYNGNTVDIPLYDDGQLNEDFALLYYELDWGFTCFEELAPGYLQEIKELINEDGGYYTLYGLLKDNLADNSFGDWSDYLDEINAWGNKVEGSVVEDSYLHDDEPVKTQWEEGCVPDDSNPHGFGPVQKDIIRFLEDVPSKVYSLNHIANEARLDRDDVFSAVKKLFRGGYLAHKYDTDVKKKQYFLTGKHLNVPGERPLYKFPPAKPQKFEDMWSCDVKDKIAKYLFHSKKPVGTVTDLADRLNINPRDVQLTLKNMIEEGVVNNGDTYTLSAGHLDMLGSLPKGSDGTLEKYYLDA
ncbi:MAG: hypothetical protein KAS90_01140 [Candidatus Aenigmarchaeota archaeon]|nr:hypothetical protein [Candidatus Aenigmarchaeota archaeon]